MPGTNRKANNKGCRIRKDLRLAIYLRDCFTCLYCLRDLREAAPFDISLDHLVARADHAKRSGGNGSKGNNDPGNLITACRSCNCSRQDKPLARFCGPETRAHIKRNTRRSIRKYRIMAKSLLADKTGGAYENKETRQCSQTK